MSTCFGVKTIFVYKRLARNLEIGNTLVLVSSNFWRLGQVRDTKWGSNISDIKLLSASKCQVYNFYRFGVMKGKSIGGKNTLSHPD